MAGLNVSSAVDYETVAASQSDQVLGANGAAGDYLKRLIVTVGNPAAATVTIKDGGGSEIPIMPGSTSIGVTVVIDIEARSKSGAWSVSTNTGASVIAIGAFS